MSTSKAIFDAALKGLKKHGPKIAAGVGGALLLVGGYLLGREVPKYQEELKKRKEEAEGELPKKEKAKIFAKHFAAPACAIVGGALSLGASVCESERRIAMGTTAAAMSEVATRSLEDHKQAVREVLGEEKAKEIEDKVEEIRGDRIGKSLDIPSTPADPGKFWCVDLIFGGKWFQTDVPTLRSIENDLERSLLVEGENATVSLNDAYERMGHELIGIGEAFVWRYDYHKKNGKGGKMVDLGISSRIIDGQPVITISPTVEMPDDVKWSAKEFYSW